MDSETSTGIKEHKRESQKSYSDSNWEEKESEDKEVDHATKKHPCAECGSILKTKATLRMHQKYVHTVEKPFSCEYCSKTFIRKSSLNDHVKTHTRQGLFKCTQCPKEFQTGSQLNRHLITHTKKSKFMCPICEYPAQSKSDLNRHTVGAHTDNTPYKCKVCGKPFGWKQNLNKHMRVHADGSGRLKKKVVLFKIPDPASLVKNLRVIYGNPALKENESRPIEIEDSSELLKQIRLKYTIGPHDCPTCGNLFVTKQNLKKHVKIHKKKEFKCEYCGKEFLLKHNLTVHIRTHTGERPYTCCECPKTFATTSTMKDHIKMCHLKENWWKCDVCDVLFTSHKGEYSHKRSKECIEAHAKAQTEAGPSSSKSKK